MHSAWAGFSLQGHSPTDAGTGFIHTCPQPFEQHIMPRAAQLIHISTQMPKPLTGGHLPGRGRTAMGGDNISGLCKLSEKEGKGTTLNHQYICMFVCL